MREQWRETTNREAIVVLPLLLIVLGVVYAGLLMPGVWAALSWWEILSVGAALALVCWVGLARSVGYSRLPATPAAPGGSGGSGGSLWHISSAPELVDVQSGDVVVLDAGRCRAMSRMFDRSRPWGRTRRAVYFFAAAPSRAAAVANVSGRRDRHHHGLPGPRAIDDPSRRRMRDR